MPGTQSSSAKITDIQVLRGFCILVVLFAHFNLSPLLLSQFSKQISQPFYLVVQLFFVISGFWITKSLSKDQFNVFKFLVKRIFRLFPALLLFLTLSYLILVFLRQSGFADYFKNEFGMPDSRFFEQSLGILGGYYLVIANAHEPHYMNGAMWSLSVEDQFYGGIVVVSFVAVASRRLTRIPAKWWVAAISAVFLLILLRYRVQVLRGRSFFELRPIVKYLLANTFDFLPLGVLLALFDNAFPGRVSRTFAVKGPALTGYLLLIPLACVAVFDSPVDMHLRARFLVGLGEPLALGCFGLLVLMAGNGCAFPTSHGRLYKFLEFFGNRSYTYYLFHLPAMVIGWLVIDRWIQWANRSELRRALVQIGVTMVMLVPVAELIYRYIEMPFTELGKRLAEGRRDRSIDHRSTPESSATLPLTAENGSAPAVAA